MCFYNDDYDWTPEVVQEEKRTSNGSVRCHECRNEIPDGEQYHWIYLQEHEVCRNCEDTNEDEDGELCVNHDYGESYTYKRCNNCDRMLRVIEQVEKDEGCPAHASRPALEELSCVFMDNFDYEPEKYARRIAVDCPDLKDHPWIKRWNEPQTAGDT